MPVVRTSAGTASQDTFKQAMACFSVKRHGIAHVFIRISNPAAVEADIFRNFGKLFYFFKLFLAREQTEMPFVFTFTNMFRHINSIRNGLIFNYALNFR
jgi:hypothetical protein